MSYASWSCEAIEMQRRDSFIRLWRLALIALLLSNVGHVISFGASYIITSHIFYMSHVLTCRQFQHVIGSGMSHILCHMFYGLFGDGVAAMRQLSSF